MQRYIVIGGMKLSIDNDDDKVIAREIMTQGGIEAAVVWERLEVETPSGETEVSWVPLEDRFPIASVDDDVKGHRDRGSSRRSDRGRG